MKYADLTLIVIALILTNIIPLSAQTAVPGINLQAINYKYIKSVGGKEEVQPVHALQQTATTYDVRTTGYYEDDYETYFVSFVIPNGETLAAYDKNGKLLRTAEKYEIELLPTSITAAIAKKYPNWVISKDIYLVTYYGENGNETKYKLILENGNKRIKIKANDAGEIF